MPVEPRLTNNNARKTTELGQTTSQVQPEQPTKFRLLVLLENTTKIIGHLIVILLLIVLASTIAADIWTKRILIDAVIVPKALEDEGYTGVVAANRIAGEIDRIERSIETLARKDKFDPNSELVPDIELPETKLSLTSTITFVENFLGIAPRHATTQLIFESGANWHEFAPAAKGMERLVISVRISGKRGDAYWSEVMVRNPDEAVMRTARQIPEMTDPYLLGLYACDVEHDLPTALNLMSEASDQNPTNPLVCVGWGNVLDEKQDHDGAIAKYQQALVLNPKYAYAYNNWGLVLAEKQDYDGAIAKYQQALALNPQSQMFRDNLARARRLRETRNP